MLNSRTLKRPAGARRVPYAELAGTLCSALIAAAILGICLIAPTEKTMGEAQRILYVHVAVAWFGLMSFFIMAGAGMMYLLRRDLSWDHWAHAAAELGWLCTALTLVTGSLWARAAWNTWWTWDPRLTSTFVLWGVYSGYLITRQSFEDRHRRARLCAVLAIVGMLDIPLVFMATRWFRGIHPAPPEMEPPMRAIMLVSVLGFSAFLAMLLARRRTQLRLEELLADMERPADTCGPFQ
jgi:heme exporter protein C